MNPLREEKRRGNRREMEERKKGRSEDEKRHEDLGGMERHANRLREKK